MLSEMFNTDSVHSRSALEIDQHAREREGQRWFLQAEYIGRKNATRKSMRKGLVTLLTGLFGLSL